MGNGFPETASWRRDLIWLILASGLLYFFALGRAPLANPDEGRYAEIPREMLARGDWVTPRLDGVDYFEKPPLLYWLVALSIKAFGPGEMALRAVPALFGIGGVVLAYSAARRLFGRASGLGAAIVLATFAFYAALARILILDMAVTVLMSATLFCFLLGIEEPAGPRRRWLFYGLYASSALATLTKGLMGFLVTGAVMLLWLAVCRQWRKLRPLYLPSGAGLFLLLAAPWHILAALRNPAWARFYFIHEHWERFTTDVHGRYHPWYWFIPILIGGLFPWLGWLGAGVSSALAGGWGRRRENARKWFFLLWASFIFAFFSLSHSKLAPYILPVFPPLAVLIGGVVATAWEERNRKAVGTGLAVFIAGSCLLAAALFLGAAIPGRLGLRFPPPLVHAVRPIAITAGLALFLGASVAVWSLREGRVRTALASVAVSIALFLGTVGFGTADLGLPSTKPLALWVRANARPADRVFFFAGLFHDFLYYAERPAGTVGFHGDEIELSNDPAAAASGRFIELPAFLKEWAGPGRIFLLGRKSAFAALLQSPSFHYHLIRQTPDFYLLSNRP